MIKITVDVLLSFAPLPLVASTLGSINLGSCPIEAKNSTVTVRLFFVTFFKNNLCDFQ